MPITAMIQMGAALRELAAISAPSPNSTAHSMPNRAAVFRPL